MPYPMTIPQYGFGPTMPPGMYDTPPGMMNFKQGGIADAQRVQSKGRGDDTMLVHMTPREVGGLQALARSRGGSLTINPQTGLPEAGFLDNFLPTLLGIGGTFLGIPPHLTAMAVGGIQTARTGDLGKGLLAGLGAYGGANLANSLSQAGIESAANAVPGVTEAAASGSLPQTAASFAPSAAPTVGETALQASFPSAGTSASGSLLAANPVTAASTMGATLPTGYAAAGEGVRSLGTEAGRNAFLNASGGYSGLAADVGMAASPALFAQPEFSVPGPKDEGSNYEGPYTPSERKLRYPTEEERRRSSEFTFFTPSNPVPFAEGGNVEDRSIKMPDASYVAGQSGGLAALKAGGLREGAFIIPADVISHLGNGSSEAGMKIVRERLNARPIKGPGDGMSDSIPTTIAGRQKARVANEEAEVPPEIVASLGGGSMEKGAQKLFEMMDNVRKARTGKKKQAPEITAERHVPA